MLFFVLKEFFFFKHLVMRKQRDMDKIIQSDSNGKLYIESQDFFRQPKVKNTITALMASDLFKKIVREKSKK